MRNLDKDQQSRGLKLLDDVAKEVSSGGQFDKRVAKLEQEVQLLRYALTNVFKTLQDFPNVKSQLDQLEYRTLGMLHALSDGPNSQVTLVPAEYGSFASFVEAKAREQKEKVFNDLSDQDDIERKLRKANDEEIDNDSTILITSSVGGDQDQGIFRSKMDVNAKEFEEHRELFIGKRVGDKVDVKLQGKDHLITILGVRKPDATSEQQQ